MTMISLPSLMMSFMKNINGLDVQKFQNSMNSSSNITCLTSLIQVIELPFHLCVMTNNI